MGQRISYYKNNFSKGLKDLIFENFAPFRQWYLDTAKFSIEGFDEPFGNEKLKEYFHLNTDFISDFDKLDKRLIDELTSEFIGSYCDLTDREGIILEFFGPMMNKWRYKSSYELIRKTKNQDFITLWNYITIGRSLKDNGEFDNYNQEDKIGFLTIDEYNRLKGYIENYFGDVGKIQKKYWTNREKRKLQQALENSKDGSYSLSGHNPVSSGIEYVLDALNELSDNNKELITAIE